MKDCKDILYLLISTVKTIKENERSKAQFTKD